MDSVKNQFIFFEKVITHQTVFFDEGMDCSTYTDDVYTKIKYQNSIT